MAIHGKNVNLVKTLIERKDTDVNLKSVFKKKKIYIISNNFIFIQFQKNKINTIKIFNV